MLKNNQKGFSLLGVIAAVFVISIGLVAILSLASFSIKSASVSEMRLIASGLAQEGIEIIRDARQLNSNWDEWQWYSEVIATSSSQSYLIQYDDSSLLPFSEIPLKLDTNGFYQYDSGDNSPFYRKITLTKISYSEVKAIIEVKWQTKDQWQYLMLEERLWQWK